MENSFKLAAPSDIEILVQFIQEFHQLEQIPFEYSTVRSLLAPLLKDSSLGRVWLIQVDNEPIGYIVLTFGYSLEYLGRDAIIDEFYIRESYRRQGIGRKTLQFIQQICPSLGIQAIHLEVDRQNITAQNLYSKMGFKNNERYLMSQRIKQ
jgi:GNAT superfamily N-acetyltransferase